MAVLCLLEHKLCSPQWGEIQREGLLECDLDRGTACCAQPKKLLERLKAPGSGGARLLLDNRIQLFEKAALLATSTRKLSEDALHVAVTTVSRAHVDIPLPVRLDLAERCGQGLMKELVEASAKETVEKCMDRFLKFLLPCKPYKLNQDDIMRPRFANLMTTLGVNHSAAMEACELKDELELKEKLDEEWRAAGLTSVPFHW